MPPIDTPVDVICPSDDDAVSALRSAVSFPTVVTHPDELDPEPFEELLADLGARFPGLNRAAEVVRLPGNALLLRWPGRGGDRPIVLLTHLDVAPTDSANAWTHPPFAGVLEDDVVWGRGTLDSKGATVAVCTAAERLIAQGFAPASDVWLFFGVDRRVDRSAAEPAVEALQDRGVEPWFVLDEGGTIADDAFPGVSTPLAVIGVAEKGLVELGLRATGPGGNPSMPPTIGAGERLARAIDRLTRRPFPASLSDTVVEMLTTVSPHASGLIRYVTRYAGPLRRPLALVFSRLGPETAALARTTTTVTRLSASSPSTELADSATATLTVRIMAGESTASVMDRVTKVIGDPEVTVTVLDGGDPSPISPTDDPAYRVLTDSLAEVMPDAVPVPYVLLAPTDARHFHRVWPRVYRFTPFRLRRSQRRSTGDVDERIEVSSFLEGVRWYQELLRHA